MKRWAMGTVVAVSAVVLPALPAAATTPESLVLVSGDASLGSQDPHTEMSLDGGRSWGPAVVSQPHYLYDVIPGTGWISTAGGGGERQYATTLFRRAFTLPATATGGALTVCVHADNSVDVSLNGTIIGDQSPVELVTTFQDPAPSASRAYRSPASTSSTSPSATRVTSWDWTTAPS